MIQWFWVIVTSEVTPFQDRNVSRGISSLDSEFVRSPGQTSGSVVQAKYGGVRGPPRGIIPWDPILRQTLSGHPRDYTANASPPAAAPDPKAPLFEDLTAPTR